MRSSGLHGGATTVLSALLILVGLVLVVRTLAAGGGGIARGVILGVLFVAVGAGRLWLQLHRGDEP
jgi:hypothetical protein